MLTYDFVCLKMWTYRLICFALPQTFCPPYSLLLIVPVKVWSSNAGYDKKYTIYKHTEAWRTLEMCQTPPNEVKFTTSIWPFRFLRVADGCNVALAVLWLWQRCKCSVCMCMKSVYESRIKYHKMKAIRCQNDPSRDLISNSIRGWDYCSEMAGFMSDGLMETCLRAKKSFYLTKKNISVSCRLVRAEVAKG